MGMSASQARLLSITSRLTNNEFRAQTITNSKLRLATESQEASQDYMDALNSQQLMFMNYDDNGSASKVTLTPAVLYDYAPLKNQYMLTNSAGKVLVNNTEIKNYEETNNLNEFLDRYGLLEYVDVKETTKKTRKETTEVDNPEWKKWKQREPKLSDFFIEHHVEDKTESGNKWVHTNSKIYDMIADIHCFEGTKSNLRCYFHVMAALLGEGTYTTSDGNTFDIYTRQNVQTNGTEVDEGLEYNGYKFSGAGWGWNSYKVLDVIESKLASIRDELKSDPVYDQTYYGDLITEKHGTVPVGGDGSDAQKYNDGGSVGGNCWQKCIDLMWKYHELYEDYSVNGGKADISELEEIWYFIEFDLGDGHMEEYSETTHKEWDEYDHEEYDKKYEEWELEEPPKTITEEKEVEYEETTISSYIVVNDQPKAQWYTNLWYKMNGSDTANVVTEIDDKDELPKELQNRLVFSVNGAEKSTNGKHYEEYDSNLFKSAEWIKFALEHGIVTMEQAQYFNPAEDSLKAMELTSVGYKWNNIVYTSARDFVQQNNDKAIAMAEVKYKKRITEIENKDTKYDQDLKKLDTEHNALQTEYESIKEVLSKNVERSFKAFS